MSDSISIRKALPAEAERLAEIGYVAWETSILPLLTESPGMRQGERRRLRMAVGEMIDRIIVADLAGIPIAWCSRAKGRSYIPFLFVAPEFQNSGLGTMLLRRMESLLELEGADRVLLETPADNVRAVRFYERQGYRILALRPDGRQGHEPFMSVRLEKLLDPYTGPVDD